GEITRIIHYGDSHVAADILSGALRRKLQYCFGDSGPGYVLAGRPWPWYSRAGFTSRMSAGWHSDGLEDGSLATDGSLGLAGVSFSAQGPGEWITLTADWQRAEIYLLEQPGGGAVDLLVDGVEYRSRVDLSSNRRAPLYISLEGDDGPRRQSPLPYPFDSMPRTIEVRTVAPGRVRILGAVLERRRAGIVYDALGINGARADRPLLWDWRLFASNLKRRDPDLIILAYGSNEVSDPGLDLEEYGRNLSTLLARIREAAPDASVLVTSPPDRALRSGTGWIRARKMAALVAAQKRAALSSGAAFWDLFHAMGGSGSIEKWVGRRPPLAQPDRVHLTREGYNLAAASLFDELMRGYQESRPKGHVRVRAALRR
ncbi:MAG TPA: GDSL-type esterase/lipase family protein, partial [Blastocatellia bacterium]|nr:GDSL-type esterase/lipase family protein [Blastocatellia bacterium]